MTRPVRLDYPGATHHIFVRAVARTTLAVDVADYEQALAFLERAVSRFELRCHAWCYLPNHSHLLVTSQLGNLSRAMHWLGTCTAQKFNHRHERVGHVYKGRFGSRIVEDGGYFLELARYLPLNPVRASLCTSPEDWHWSSYAASVGLRPAPRFLDRGEFLARFGSNEAYANWVADGILATSLDENGVPRGPDKTPLADLLEDDSDGAIANAHHQHGYTQIAIAQHLGVSCSQISRRLALHR
jgi:putative transposase